MRPAFITVLSVATLTCASLPTADAKDGRFPRFRRHVPRPAYPVEFFYRDCFVPQVPPPPGGHGWNADRFYPEQGWGRDLTQRFYHTPEGTFLMPYAWAEALVRDAGKTSLYDLVKEYGVLPDDATPDLNPAGLPVGFAIDARSGTPWLGITCALCHAGELRYGTHKVRVPGGSAPVDYPALIKGVFGRLVAMAADGEKAKALVAGGDEPAARQLAEVVGRAKAYLARADAGLMPVAHGPYRLDALTLGAVNLVIAGRQKPPANAAAVLADAPVSYPSLWHGPWRDSVQYAVAIHSPLPRNVMQALGSSFVPGPHAEPHKALDFPNLIATEEWLRDLAPPAWPEHLFGPIDRDKAARGRELFARHCLACHNWKTTAPTADGVAFYRTVEVPPAKTGTDPTLFNRFQGPEAAVRMTVLRDTSNALMAKFFADANLPPKDRSRATLGKENVWAVRPGYGAGPLDGIWATAPYLHNGSVPTLYDLLSPVAERPPAFNLGGLAFDPVKVGLASSGPFTFDTKLPGNRNTGHEYPKQQLTPEERWDLVEYLKAVRPWRLDGR